MTPEQTAIIASIISYLTQQHHAIDRVRDATTMLRETLPIKVGDQVLDDECLPFIVSTITFHAPVLAHEANRYTRGYERAGYWYIAGPVVRSNGTRGIRRRNAYLSLDGLVWLRAAQRSLP